MTQMLLPHRGAIQWPSSFLDRAFGMVIAPERAGSGVLEGGEPDVALYSRAEELIQILPRSFSVAIQDAVAVRAYLVRFPEVSERLLVLVEHLRREFGITANLVLDVNRDPEIVNEFLLLLVRPLTYNEQTMERIRSIRNAIARSLPEGEGRIHATTDFR